MRKQFVYLFLAAALVVQLAACSKTKDEQVSAALKDLDAFTSELVQKVDGAQNPADGVEDAQALLDRRKDTLKEKLSLIKSAGQQQVTADVQRDIAETIKRDVSSVMVLSTKYSGSSITDPTFKTKLDKLVGDYQELFRL